MKENKVRGTEYIVRRLKEMGFTVDQKNEHMICAYISENMQFVEQYGYRYYKGTTIEIEETYRSNGTADNVNINLMVTKWDVTTGRRVQKPLKVRMDARESLKEKRVQSIVALYEENK